MHARDILVSGLCVIAGFCLSVPSRAGVTENYQLPRPPNLEIQPPPGFLQTQGVGYGPWDRGNPEINQAIRLGRSLATQKAALWAPLRPWRVLVDSDGEYATLLSPPAVACLLGYYAEQRAWPPEEMEKRLADALDRFGKGICIYVELRSYAHESRGFGSAGEIRPGTPAEACDALFLLDAGGTKVEGQSSQLPDSSHINSHGLHYEVVELPEVRSTTLITKVHTWGQSYGANYYLWWPLWKADGSPSFGDHPERLRITIITPARQRDFSFEVKKP